MPDSNRNLSYYLNSYEWADPLISSIGGSASRVSMSDPASAVANVAQSEPGQFRQYAGFLLPQDAQANDSPVATRKVTTGTALDYLNPFYWFNPLTGEVAGSSAADAGRNVQNWGKYFAVLVLALVIVTVGLIAIIGPRNIVTATKAAA